MKALIDSNSTILNNWCGKLIEDIRKSMNVNNINASGELSNSLEYTIKDNGIKFYANDYFEYAEMGRRSGGVPYYFEEILNQWIKNKGIGVPSKFKTSLEFANAIKWKIKKYGSSKYRNPATRVDLLTEPLNDNMPDLDDIVANQIVFCINDNLSL